MGVFAEIAQRLNILSGVKADLVNGVVPVSQVPGSTSATANTIAKRRSDGALAGAAADNADELTPLAQVQDLIGAIPPAQVDPEQLRTATPWRPPADFPVPVNSTAVVATNFTRPLDTANRAYRFRLRVVYDMDQAADVQFKLVGPSGCVLSADTLGPVASATGAGASARSGYIAHDELAAFGGLSVSGTPAKAAATFTGECAIGATTGDLTLWVRQGTSSAVAGSLKAADSLFDLELCAP